MAVCRGSFDFVFTHKLTPQNYLNIFDYCTDHAGNTCCQMKQVDAIRKRVDLMPANDMCKEVSSQVFCANCDGLIGTHKLHGICQHVCDVWYDACQYSSYCQQPHFDNCNSGQQLRWIVSNSTQFCDRMGYPVTDSLVCWDGIAAASRNQIAKPNGKKTGKVKQSWLELFTSLFGQIRWFSVACIACIISIFLGLAWYVNQWQLRLMTEDESRWRQKKQQQRQSAKRREQHLRKQFEDVRQINFEIEMEQDIE